MIDELPPLWGHQGRGVFGVINGVEQGLKRILLTSPTGGGKTRIVQELIAYCLDRSWEVTIYTNRNLLREQTAKVLSRWGIDHGIRAAGNVSDLDKAVQVTSVQSEKNRVFGTAKRQSVWPHHKCQLVVSDEIHMQQGESLAKLKELHLADGAVLLDVTATPMDLAGPYDLLVQAGTTSELRECGALLWARHHAIDEPDTRKVRSNAAGEYEIEPGRFRTIWVKSIVGRVIDNYRRLNPDQRPTILFAPGVEESIWFAEQMSAAGLRWAHIDGKNVWLDGELHSGGDLRNEVIAELKAGKLAGVSNRFVLREGIDIPELYMGILATVFGSLQSYLQSVGRLLRSFPSYDHVCIADHGGNWWRHGSPNADRVWTLGMRSRIENATREDRVRNGEEELPLICPQCGLLRGRGRACAGGGYDAAASRRRTVIQHDGTLREVTSNPLPPKFVKTEPDTEQKWRSMYYRAKRSRNNMTFRSAVGLFVHENGYWPPDNLPLMPRRTEDWFAQVRSVPVTELR